MKKEKKFPVPCRVLQLNWGNYTLCFARVTVCSACRADDHNGARRATMLDPRCTAGSDRRFCRRCEWHGREAACGADKI